ncbi:adenosine kinase [Desulfotignum phosphitoxidans]|jgi:sugar/nucleoside kinase (ribokinase family)|uniref:Putative SAM-methyltransferase n=1 Tax=Desulfotignum phosphitoxidans DSM 13687 TaxID=1286635 RepID=S0FXE8_9BACT|nr:adenosine kinase [Desulfotignum phosphitoxidans]EMS77829.1 putative SAM-methyltransferase [Desulfotignum phosphitoxidans DSM 13687]
MTTQPYSKRITGIGSALVDILINESDDFLKHLGKEKGGMTLVESADIKTILAKTDKTPAIVPGGAACNTIIGIGRLGGTARFIGRRGDDNFGTLFEDALRSARVEPELTLSPSPTGSVISVITPDAQRSMFTYLGASTELEPHRITASLFADTAITMIEGYLLFNPELMMAAVHAAKKAGAMIALDLASFEVVHASREILDDLIKDHVDILIANEDEAEAFTGYADEKNALQALSAHVTYGVLKLGKRGSLISFNNTTTRIDARTGKEAKDTTGAGDLWAAGFLFGIANGFSIEKSGQLASACGYEVCQVIGAQIPEEGWERIRALI